VKTPLNLLFFTWFYFIVGVTNAQENMLSWISGSVSNMQDNSPVPNCPVVLRGSDGALVQTKTSLAGNYSMRLRPGVKYEIYTNTDKTVITPTAKFGFLASDDRGIFESPCDSVVHFIKDFQLTMVYVCEPRMPRFIFKKNSVLLDTLYSEGLWMDASDYDSAYIFPKAAIAYYVKLLKKNPTIIIELSAHCSSEETPNAIAADKLSLQRAAFIKSEIVKRGIDPVRIVAKGWGERKLKIQDAYIAKEKTKEGKEKLHALNRRCVMKIISWDYEPPAAANSALKFVLNGTVRNSLDKTPVPGCKVILKGNDGTMRELKTDSTGSYSASLKPGFAYEVYVACDHTVTTPTCKQGFMGSGEKGSFITEGLAGSQNFQRDFELRPDKQGCGPICAPIIFKPNSMEYDVVYGTVDEWTDSAYYLAETSIALIRNILVKMPCLKIELSGHCSTDEKDKEALSKLRAETVKAELVKRGIAPGRISIKGYADTKLKINDQEISEEKSKDGQATMRAMNRRCVFRVISSICDETLVKTEKHPEAKAVSTPVLGIPVSVPVIERK
jgi:outer membrane protein OmpA-like peptidoglycan-associated protein